MMSAFRRVRTTAVAAGIGVCLLALTTISSAQQRSQNLFRGVWEGTLTPNVVFGVPEDALERLSKPVTFELRVFNRGRVEAYFISDEEEWEFTERGFQLTEIGENGVILGRLTGGSDRAQNAFSFNLTQVDDETILVDWSRIQNRGANPRYDGLDEMAFAGTNLLKLTDD